MLWRGMEASHEDALEKEEILKLRDFFLQSRTFLSNKATGITPIRPASVAASTEIAVDVATIRLTDRLGRSGFEREIRRSSARKADWVEEVAQMCKKHRRKHVLTGARRVWGVGEQDRSFCSWKGDDGQCGLDALLRGHSGCTWIVRTDRCWLEIPGMSCSRAVWR